MGIIRTIFKSDNDRNVKKLEKIAALIEEKADFYATKTDEELKETTLFLKKRLADGETLDDILPDAFALVREAGWRVLNMRHFHVQLLGGIALFQGRISEMRTGEGKTLTETLPAYLQALDGKGVHIVTVNEYLAKRDAEWMGKIFLFLGLTVGVVATNMNPDEKRAAYNCDITYGTNNEFGFDYLRDNMARRKEERMARGYNFAIVDEVDSILVDEARTPLIISGQGMKSNDTYRTADRFVKSLNASDYEIDEKEKRIRLTESGVNKAERFFNLENLSDITNIEVNHHINNALHARHLKSLDNDYIIDDGEIVIVDEFTGRLMVGRRYSNGLHQAIEAKEGLQIKDEDKTLATVTFQNFFRLYKKLSGMTGTAKTEEMEFNKIYNLDVVQIPTNMPIQRKDFPDIVFKTEPAKYRAVIDEIKETHAEGRPVLVGTVTIEKSEMLSKELKKHKIGHVVLNAKNHQQESEIVAQAGRLGAVTIATNMAGRGTDILLGGNPEFLAKQKMRELGASDAQLEYCTSLNESGNEELNELRRKYKRYLAEYKAQTDKEKDQVKALGGLHIIGTERHESRRIDNQLRGRAGRQGDPGSSVFYISTQDELIRRFGGETMEKMLNVLRLDEDTPLQFGMLSKRIEGAQRRIEGFNFSSRHNTLRFDDVLNQQRTIIYDQRNNVLDGINFSEEVAHMIEEYVVNICSQHITEDKLFDQWDLDALNNALNTNVFFADVNFVTPKLANNKDADEMIDVIVEYVLAEFNKKIQAFEQLGLPVEAMEGDVLLRVVDTNWMTHIDFMSMLRNEIGLRAYGNHDPVVAYKQEGFEVFDQMVLNIREQTAKYLLSVKAEVRINPQMPKDHTKNMTTNRSEGNSQAKSNKVVGRNDTCPCGSGKKNKNCCNK